CTLDLPQLGDRLSNMPVRNPRATPHATVRSLRTVTASPDRPGKKTGARPRPARSPMPALIAATAGLLLALPHLHAAGPDVPALPVVAPGVVAEPLAPQSGPRGETLFVLMSPEETGVYAENNYDDPEMWGKRHRELEVG